MVPVTTTVDLPEARRIAVAAQGLAGGVSDLADLLATVSCVQVDAIAVVRRSHELVALSRGLDDPAARSLGSARAEVSTFEYWGHAVSILPIDLWPFMAYRRRRFRDRGWRGPTVDPLACDDVLARLSADGPCTLRDLGGAQGSGWERSSPNRWAAEWLQALGHVVVLERRGTQRVYALAEEALPATALAAEEPDDETCLRHLTGLSLRALGVATTGDVADYFRLPVPAVERCLRDLDVSEVRVETWTEPAWLAPSVTPAAGPTRVTPLSPFDSLVWHRPRQARLFGRAWILEAYKAASKREFGYFAMPILAGTRLAGRIAARCGRDRVFRVEALEWDETAELVDGPAAAVDRMAEWTSAVSVDIAPHAQRSATGSGCGK